MPQRSNPLEDMPPQLSLAEGIDQVYAHGASNPSLYINNLPDMIGNTILNEHLMYLSRRLTADIMDRDVQLFMTAECQAFMRGARLGMAALRYARSTAVLERYALYQIVPNIQYRPKHPPSTEGYAWLAHHSYELVPEKLQALTTTWKKVLVTSDAHIPMMQAGLGTAWNFIERTEDESFRLRQAALALDNEQEVANWDAELLALTDPGTE